jgi:hypothetical protein
MRAAIAIANSIEVSCTIQCRNVSSSSLERKLFWIYLSVKNLAVYKKINDKVTNMRKRKFLFNIVFLPK